MLKMLTRIFGQRRTDPDSDRGQSLLFIPRSDSGMRINHDTALMLSTVWGCVRVISEALSQLPWRVMRRSDNGNEIVPSHPADRLLHVEPNGELTPAVWRELMLRDVLTWGNGYSEIERDASQRPIALWPISPDRVMPERVSGVGLVYWVYNRSGDPTPVPPESIFHLRGLGDDLSGWSVIQHARNAIGLGMAEEQSVSAFLRNDSRPAGILTPKGSLNKVSAEQIRAEWEEIYGGSGNRGRTALLPVSMDYQQMGLPSADSQLLENRQFSVLEICRFFRVPPHKVFDLTRATFSNIEHQAIEFVQDTLVPWGVKLEQEANRKLIAAPARSRMFTKVNFNALLRGDFESRAKGYQMLFDRGIYSINDILELEDRNTIGSDGDERFVPMNFQTLTHALEEPEPVPAPLQQATLEKTEEPDMAAMRQAYVPVIADTIDRVTNRCLHNLTGRSGKGNYVEREMGERYLNYVIEQISPHIFALAALTGRTFNISEWASKLIEERKAHAIAHFAAGGDQQELALFWRGQTGRIVGELLK